MKAKNTFILAQAYRTQSRHYCNHTKILLNRTNFFHNQIPILTSSTSEQPIGSKWIRHLLKFSTLNKDSYFRESPKDYTKSKASNKINIVDCESSAGRQDINHVDSEWLTSYNSKFSKDSQNSSNEFHKLLKDIRLIDNRNINSTKLGSDKELNQIANDTTTEAIHAAKDKGFFYYPASKHVPYVTLVIMGTIIATQIYFYIQIYQFRNCQTTQEIVNKSEEIISQLNFFSLKPQPSTLTKQIENSPSTGNEIPNTTIQNNRNESHKFEFYNFFKFFFLKSLTASLYLSDSTPVLLMKGLSFFLAGSFLERLWGPMYFSTFILVSTYFSNLFTYYFEKAFFPNFRSLEMPLQGTTGFITACVLATAIRYPNAAIYKGIPITNRFLISPLAVFLLNDFIDILQYTMKDAKKHFERKNYSENKANDNLDNHLYAKLIKARLIHLGCALSEEEAKFGLYKPKEASRFNKSTLEELTSLEKQWSEIGSPNFKGISDFFSLFSICFIMLGSRFLKRS